MTMFADRDSYRFQEKKESQKAAAPPTGSGYPLSGNWGEGSPDTYSNPDVSWEFLSQLWIRGEYLESDSRAVAIVGSRACSNEGAQDAYELSTELVQSGVCIVSGLALGIDGFAHRAALKAGGRTLAVLGTGLDHIRPVRHRSLYKEILTSGAGVSPFPPSFTGYSDGRNYLQRNTVIAGLSRVLVVADARARSGSLSAARSALRQGRPVGIMASLLRSQSWAESFCQQPGVFVVNSVADVLERVGS